MTTERLSAKPAPFGDAERQVAARLAYEHLAPVISRYLMLLDAHVRYAARTEASVLFVSRAGVRIRRLYDEFTATRGLVAPPNCDFFWVSRCLTAKAAWSRTPDEALSVFLAEYRHERLGGACVALLGASTPSGPIHEGSDTETNAPVTQLQQFLGSNHALARAVVEHLRDQGILFAEYVRATIGPGERVVLVDTGWHGTTQRLLRKAYAQYDWSGLYFGRIARLETNPEPLGQSIALVFEASRFDPSRPESAFVLYRHLIEGLLEPRAKSVEYLEPQPGASPWAPESAPLLAEVPTPAMDPIYCAVLTYLRETASKQSLTQLAREGAAAMSRLARILAFPSREEALALGGLSISHGFGRPVRHPVLIEVDGPDQAAHRINRALWHQGQIALEYSETVAHERQRSQLEIAASLETAAPL
jgi:hypothetical protein